MSGCQDHPWRACRICHHPCRVSPYRLLVTTLTPSRKRPRAGSGTGDTASRRLSAQLQRLLPAEELALALSRLVFSASTAAQSILGSGLRTRLITREIEARRARASSEPLRLPLSRTHMVSSSRHEKGVPCTKNKSARRLLCTTLPETLESPIVHLQRCAEQKQTR
jgi:hypothetical protein